MLILAAHVAHAAETPLPEGGYCSGAYADDFSSLSPRVRDAEKDRSDQYSYCLRSTATYECLAYGADGNVRKIRKKASRHGTGFGYRRVGNETLMLTNFHVAEWPSVSDEDHPVSGVPLGCKKISDAVHVVDNEDDAYERDDIALGKVVADPQLDVSIVKASTPLRVLPWKLGKSSALKARNVVEIRGFPLGAFRATNVGKVIAPYDLDEFRDYDHVDFVVDALVSSGNSGSPVLAVSCQTGEYELVGIFHAAYTRGAAMNVVVGIDQVRDMMTTLKRTPRQPSASIVPADPAERSRLEFAAGLFPEPFFPFGNLPAVVRARGNGTLLFEVFSEDFPTKVYPLAILEDAPVALAPGTVPSGGRVYFGNPRGLKGYQWSTLDGETQSQLLRLRDALRHDAMATFDVRAALMEPNGSRERFEELSRLEKKLKRASGSRNELAQALEDLAERLGPKPNEAVTPFAEALALPPGMPGSAPSANKPAGPPVPVKRAP